MAFPDFYLIGASKSGTTALYEFLRQHPQVFMPRNKEPNHWGRADAATSRQTARYLRLFRGATPGQKVGDASPAYMTRANAAQQIRQAVPDARIICLLREPVGRLYSYYWHNLWVGRTRARTFEDWVLDADGPGGVVADRIRYSDYATQLARYFDVFGRGPVGVWSFEEFQADNEGVFQDVCRHIGVPHDVPLRAKAVNTARRIRNLGLHVRLRALEYRLVPDGRFMKVHHAWSKVLAMNTTSGRAPAMRPETRDVLWEALRPDIVRLERLLGRDLSFWRP